MRWKLAADEALILEFDDYEGFWMFTNMGTFWNSMDYLYRPVSYTPSRTAVDADGRVRLVMAHEDPGFHNWIDTQGFEEGYLTYRNVQSRHLPADRRRRSCATTTSVRTCRTDSRRVDVAERGRADARTLRRDPAPVPDVRPGAWIPTSGRSSPTAIENVYHFGHVVPDLRSAMDAFGRAPPAHVVDAVRDGERLRRGPTASPTPTRSASPLSAEGPPFLELIEVVPRPGSIFAEPAGGGFHHVGFYAERWRDEVARASPAKAWSSSGGVPASPSCATRPSASASRS